jgi:tetratricopeptide (TPR) repeat protein
VEAVPYTQYALLHRGAEYFKQARQPRETWKKLDDLTPQLNEFELRFAGENYDTAASVLLEIDFDYLQLWGHYRLMMDLHERLQGKIEDQSFQQFSVGKLGSACAHLGKIQEAIAYQEKALALARDMKDRANEGTWLGNLGNRLADLGQTTRAIEYYEQALAIAREIGIRRGEGADLGNLGNCYAALGQTTRAIEYYEQALAIDREIGDRRGEGLRLGNLAEVLIDEGRYIEAIHRAEEYVKICKGIEKPSSYAYGRSALAWLYSGDLSRARAAAEAARKSDEPQNNHNTHALLGVIALRQNDLPAAKAAFMETVMQADDLLTKSAQNYAALDSKGLALCGLALCGDAARVNDAIAAYRAAREINKDAGIVKRVLRLFDALAVVDTEGLLRDVRSAAAGE